MSSRSSANLVKAGVSGGLMRVRDGRGAKRAHPAPGAFHLHEGVEIVLADAYQMAYARQIGGAEPLRTTLEAVEVGH